MSRDIGNSPNLHRGFGLVAFRGPSVALAGEGVDPLVHVNLKAELGQNVAMTVYSGTEGFEGATFVRTSFRGAVLKSCDVSGVKMRSVEVGGLDIDSRSCLTVWSGFSVSPATGFPARTRRETCRKRIHTTFPAGRRSRAA